MQRLILSLFAVLTTFALASPASATTYSLIWNGTVDASSDDTGIFGIVHNAASNPDAYAGMSYTATYLFDSSLGNDLGGPHQLARGGGNGTSVSPILAASVTVNGHTVNMTGHSVGSVQVQDGTFGGARYYAEDDPTSLRQLILSSNFVVSGGASMPLSFGPYIFNSALGNGESEFSQSDFNLVTFQTARTQIRDTFTSFTVSVVNATPLPAALPFFVTGLGVLGWFARGRKTTAARLAN